VPWSKEERVFRQGGVDPRVIAMRFVGVLSDSHDNLAMISKAVERLRSAGVSEVIHAGDIISPFALRRFSGLKLFGVFGNNDGDRLLLAKVASEMGFVLTEQPLVVEIDGYRLAVIHGIQGAERTRAFAYSLARSEDFDVVIYGHLHRTEVKKVGDSLVVNPGELCGYLSGQATIALVDLEERVARIEHLKP